MTRRYRMPPLDEYELTIIQRQVLRLVLDGDSNLDIAMKRGVSKSAVTQVVSKLLIKFEAKNRWALIAMFGGQR